jgi:hypothetical protein
MPKSTPSRRACSTILLRKWEFGAETPQGRRSNSCVLYRNCDTLTHLLKASLGTGILSMPAAFKASGLVLGIFATIVVSIICTHCAYILVSIQVNPHCWITHFFATDQNCHTMSFQTIINAQKKNLSRSFSFSIYATNFLSFILSLSALGLLSVFIFHNYFGFLLPYVTR